MIVYQWLDLEKLKIVEPDLSIFTVDEFDLVRDQISKEPVAFFKEVLSSNLSLENFIDSDFVMITPNPTMSIESKDIRLQTEQATGCEQDIAKGLPSQADHLQVHQSGWATRTIREVCSQAGFMLMTTNTENTPIRFIVVLSGIEDFTEILLRHPRTWRFRHLAPPKTKTIKETIDAHREDASCNICHKKMDPRNRTEKF